MPSVLQLYFALSLFHLYIHLLGEWSSTVTSPMAGVCHSRQLTVPRWAKCIATSFGVRREGVLTDDAWPSLFGQTCMSESLSVLSFICWCIWSIVAGLAGQSSCAKLCKHMCLTPCHPTSCRLEYKYILAYYAAVREGEIGRWDSWAQISKSHHYSTCWMPMHVSTLPPYSCTLLPHSHLPHVVVHSPRIIVSLFLTSGIPKPEVQVRQWRSCPGMSCFHALFYHIGESLRTRLQK